MGEGGEEQGTEQGKAGVWFKHGVFPFGLAIGKGDGSRNVAQRAGRELAGERVFTGNAGIGDGRDGMESESAIVAGIADEHGGRMPQCGGLGEGLADEGRSDALGAPFERHG